MTEINIAPYGSWKSPITSDLIVAGTVGLRQVALDGGDVYWIESRPTEGGRGVIVKRTPDGQTADINPAPFNARTRAHEYGGGEYLVADGTVWFVHFADQRLYRVEPGGEPRPLTSEARVCFADPIFDRSRNRIICVCEDFEVSEGEPQASVSSIDAETGERRVLASGHDFYSSPRLSPDGARLAWLTWTHPNMPWDGTSLWVADIGADGSLGEPVRVAGGPSESIFQPEWSPGGVLHFVSDRTGWWNLYRWDGAEAEALCPRDAEFGEPQWVFGLSLYGFASDHEILCAYGDKISRLAKLDTRTGELENFDLPSTVIDGVRVGGGKAAFLAGSPTEMMHIAQVDSATGKYEVLRRSSALEIDEGYISAARPVEFPTEDGLTAHGYYYPPKNRDFTAPEGERPPLLVKSHGGPTAATSSILKLGIQYWTSRGFAVLDVNYGGSTGYGREYRERLKDRWGIVDVDDCCNGAKFLVEQGLADAGRLAIDGGSAGGYTTLAALTFRNVFKAGASHYGVSDLEALAKDTHKFESRYLDGLVGPYPARRDIYVERSPIHHTDRLSCPVIFFQGLDDKVVPPSQAEMMFDALKAKGVPTAYVAFEGEQHGFRRAENIKRALDGELYFYSRIFGFELAEPVEPVPIENL